ncbi:TPA: M48 family peptidase [bacterium]|nr:M48 family peptidase [bacterium]
MDIELQSEITDKQKAKRYNNIKQFIDIGDFVLQIGFMQIVLLFGFSELLASQITKLVSNAYISMLIYVSVIGTIGGLLMFPIELYSGFILEHRYQLSNQNFRQWFVEQAKRFLISSLIFLPMMFAIYFCIRRFSYLWWLPVACFIFIFSTVLSLILPIVIMPLFYKFTPIEDEEIRDRLTSLAEKMEIKVKGVYSFDMSKDTRKANAALAGIGRTKRIVLADTLLSGFSIEEIESVFVHEVAHQKYHHIWKSIFAGAASNFLGLFFVADFYYRLIGVYGFQSIQDIPALPILGTLLGLWAIFALPFGNAISRFYEKQCDEYTIKHVGAEPFISAMKKIASMNLSDETPNPIIEFLFYSHPSISRRIKMAENLKN